MAAAFFELDGVVPRPGGGAVSVAVPRGGRLVLLGGPGVGKTALLLCIGGFLTPVAGDIRLDGRSILGLPPERRRAVLLPAEGALFAHRSLRDNLRFAAPGRDAARADALLAAHGLASVARLRPARLSAAQRRLGELVRALATEPSLLLIDGAGPFDPAPVAAAGVTAVLATDQPEAALGIATTILLLDAQGMVQLGTPHELYEQPANGMAARFMGPCNLIASPRGLLAVRPHRLRIDPAGTLRGRVVSVAYRGPETQVRVATDAAGEVTAHIAQPIQLAVGDTIGLAWNDADAWQLPELRP